ncbi:MAG: sigma-54 dependent transcriptional regulator [Candidatus Sumerlaeota bacterium]|nr:sigma-54 dependent transcriptional regulator [Candidatus Sumerlaeota bacterium]
MDGHILIIEDEPKMGKILQRVLAREGYEVVFAEDPVEGLNLLRAEPFHVLLTDLKMPKLSGIEVLEQAKAIQPECDVILMTAFASVESAVEAMKKGAFDYLIKPFANEELKILVRRVIETKSLKEENEQLKVQLDQHASFENIIAVSKPMREVLDRVRKVAASEASVLLRGASGTGKEILAVAIHRSSARRNGPMIKVNCGALPETLLESELFGHARGAFTGAVGARKGLFEAAHGGTIFLDEIGEVTPALQVKLLRILQEGEFQRVGESETRKVNVRVIAATNRSLEEAMQAGTFRSDLYFRLNVVPIYIPPLAERREDIPALIEHFLARLQKGEKRPKRAFSPPAFDVMVHYDWPGNVRELENAVEHALVMGEGESLEIPDLPLALQNFHAKRDFADQPVIFDHLTLEEIEKRCILNALRRANNNHTRAAKLLGITRRTLGYRIQKYGLEVAKAKDEEEGPSEKTALSDEER